MTNLHNMLKGMLMAGAVALVVPMPVSAESELMDMAGDTAKEVQWQVDFRGKPPYKRKRVLVDVVDVAAIEPVETQVVWQRSSGGKPPFKRRWVEVPVVDTASLELVPAEEQKVNFRGRPPFRRH